ncbi:MAG: MCE family protein [Pseudonocardia sp.]|nr:MCE family protein [Pseudonocardia sp.]
MLVLVVVLVLAGGASMALASTTGGYRVEFLMPSADGTFPGDPVKIGGQDAGTVRSIGVRDNKALVTVDLDDAFAPLHAGTNARIDWEAVLSERFLDILPGPATNPVIPSGGRIVATIERVELGDLLSMLDPKTLTDANSLVQQVSALLKDREPQARATLATGGPALNGLGEVLQGIGSDGPAIRDLVSQLHQITGTLAARDAKVAGTVRDLGQLTGDVAGEQEQLADGLKELPPTLGAVKATLDKVPDAVDQTVPLLTDLQPATARLPGIAANLNPVLSDLRPAVGDLRPTLDAANALLRRTPGLLDSAHGVLPQATDIVHTAEPAVAFLRPYTPELTGWFSNWTGIFAGNDATGNYARALLTASVSSVGDNPGVMPPGQSRDERPAPGSIVGQPWTDANGDGQR